MNNTSTAHIAVESFEPAPADFYRPKAGFEIVRDAFGVAVAMALMVSTSTTGVGFTSSDMRYRTSAAHFSFRQRYRSITLSEARRIALNILFEAEEERRKMAEADGRRGIDWAHG